MADTRIPLLRRFGVALVIVTLLLAIIGVVVTLVADNGAVDVPNGKKGVGPQVRQVEQEDLRHPDRSAKP